MADARPPAVGSAVRMRDAVVLLDRFPALAGVDLDVARGEIVLLRGPNGAGKTTLLRTCAGLARVVQGTVEVLGEDLVATPRSVRRRVGMLSHQDGLYADLTVEDNVRFWARAAGADLDDARSALARCDLDGRLATVPAARLSAGQKRRTALAALLARRPELWLLDEPHAGLDRAGRDLVDRLVRDAAAAGATVLFASHELDRAEGLATRAVTIAGGQIRDDSATPAGPIGAERAG
ncbi:heme ABC exporter ATP-binding protein CcmA [Acidimicrobiia bacterium EGI L10123]|uniref:heme ABC exporter ATP-binding protein CcmA n=1 Tax=Salinilacustrithrix flava TaxID=2957203 RepID=UPI003D7C21AA|nr:heme ABC exporter ATP-binding protein CcmA [Acidimicrobiia bacterium EGI L10123]